MTQVVIIGAGPGGYEAALVAAQLGAGVTIVDSDGPGGSAVLTDCVPSKTLIATADLLAVTAEAGSLGIRVHGEAPRAGTLSVDMTAINQRVKDLAAAQSRDIAARLERDGVDYVRGRGRLESASRVIASTPQGEQTLDADVILLATGARPRIMDDAQPDGERILTWDQVYDLDCVPERMIVVGSGVTGAEFASAYHALGTEVVLVSSRDRVLPGEDPDAAAVIEEAFAARGMTVLERSRANAVRRTDDGVVVTLGDGTQVEGSHALLALGSVPNTEGLGLAEVGVEVDDRGFIVVDRVSRTSARGVYAAGDCTGVLMLASVAAMQGRIAMWHALGDSVGPLDRSHVSSTVFTTPEIATVGVTQREVDEGLVSAESVLLPLGTNARAKMQDIRHGFVKLFCRPSSRIVIGGVVVGPRASELIHPIAVAVDARLTVDQLAGTFTVYPSLSGSIAEAARRLHRSAED
ncbi:MAG: NAD(P)H-quinone dehydrogenase [Actinobacteria bacterium]|nr:NAD(P)H-quinone dehydrogenase [Actinomycetota bacterium]